VRALLAALLLCYPTSQSIALSLQVTPVLLQVDAPNNAATVTLRNSGSKPLTAQIRVFRWDEASGQEKLDPTTDVVASPPAVQLQPEQDYVLRIVRLKSMPVEHEESYRLLIDELPDAQFQTRTVNFVVRHAIPVFFDSPTTLTSQFTAKVKQSAHAITLTVANDGDRRIRLAGVNIQDQTGKRISFGPGLVGYALGHSTMNWTISVSKITFKPGSHVNVTGQSESGFFSIGAEVQSTQ